MKRRLTTLLVGDTARNEFRDARSVLCGMTHVLFSPNLDAALDETVRGGLLPDLIVLAQARPGEHSPAKLDRLRQHAPLSPVVGLLGSWCEGETRSGQPWPGVMRVYWYDWAARCTPMLEKMQADACPSWGLPATATEEERLLATVVEPQPPRSGLIAIATHHSETADALSGACAERGYATVWLHPNAQTPVRGAVAAIWEGGQLDAAEADELGRLATQLGGAAVIALLDFPRATERELAFAQGAYAVVAKPLVIDDVFWHIERHVGADRPSHAGESTVLDKPVVAPKRDAAA